MSKKYYDDFTKLPLDKMAQAMEDITYLFQETQVPKKHYKQHLTQSVEEMIESSVEINLIDTYYRTLEQLKKQNEKWLFQAQLCLDIGVKPSTITPAEYQALELTYLEFKEAKKAKLSDKIWRDTFENIKVNGATYQLKERE